MDVVKAATELRYLLLSHDRTVQALAALEAYIDNRRKRLLYLDLDPLHSNTALQISTATGVKQMYEHYRVTRIQKVQKLSHFIISTLSPDQATDNQINREPSTPVTMDTVASLYTRHSTRWCRQE